MTLVTIKDLHSDSDLDIIDTYLKGTRSWYIIYKHQLSDHKTEIKFFSDNNVERSSFPSKEEAQKQLSRLRSPTLPNIDKDSALKSSKPYKFLQ